MKTYFMAWETDNKRGHSIHQFKEDVSPLEVIRYMLKTVKEDFDGRISGALTASQFNRVE